MDKKENVLLIRDNGVGMIKEDFIKNFGIVVKFGILCKEYWFLFYFIILDLYFNIDFKLWRIEVWICWLNYIVVDELNCLSVEILCNCSFFGLDIKWRGFEFNWLIWGWILFCVFDCWLCWGY